MGRPAKGSAPLDRRVPVHFSEGELRAIDDWRFLNRIGSRSEAIRILIADGLSLKAERKP